MHSKIVSILKNKTGYFLSDGEAVIIVLEDPETLKAKMSIGGGTRLQATAYDIKTGAEYRYSLYKDNDPYTLDLSKLKKFKSFGTSSVTSLLDDII